MEIVSAGSCAYRDGERLLKNLTRRQRILNLHLEVIGSGGCCLREAADYPELMPRPRPQAARHSGGRAGSGNNVHVRRRTPPVVDTLPVYLVLAIPAGTEVVVIASVGGGKRKSVNGCATDKGGIALSVASTVNEYCCVG